MIKPAIKNPMMPMCVLHDHETLGDDELLADQSLT
jgi:hypothetical protein